MSSERKETLLFNTAVKVFESTAFAFVDPPSEEPAEAPSGDCSAYHIPFEGAFAGAILMKMPVELPALLASNMLGVEPDDPEVTEQSMEAMGELLNIICGNVLPLIAGPSEEFILFSPRAISEKYYKEFLDRKREEHPVTTRLTVEGFQVDLALVVYRWELVK